MAEREVVRERPTTTEREVIVDDRAPRRGGGGGIIAAIIGIILVVLVGWFLLNALGILGDAAEDAEVNVQAPEEIQVEE